MYRLEGQIGGTGGWDEEEDKEEETKTDLVKGSQERHDLLNPHTFGSQMLLGRKTSSNI